MVKVSELSVSFWINFGLCLTTLLCVWLYTHDKILKEFRASIGKDKRKKAMELILLWAIPVGTVVATIFAGWEGVMSDRKTASLSSQLNVAKEKLAKVDPHNQPIATVSAFVHIIVRGPIQTRKFHVANDMGTYSLHLGRHEQIESNLWIVRLVSDSFSEFSTTNETHIRMEFRMSSFSPHWNIKSMTTREIDQLDVLEITALFLPENSEVLGGSAVVTFNSIIQKDYPFPPQKLEIPRLLGIAPTEKLTIQNAAAQYHP